jgi:hypothetical protein
MFAKERKKKEKTFKEIFDDQVLNDHEQNLFYYHLVNDIIFWENPHLKNNMVKQHVQNYENIEIKTWNFDYYMKFYNETEKENDNIFVKMSRDDLLYFLNQQQGQDNIHRAVMICYW